MQTFLLASVSIFFFYTASWATVRTVSNHPAGGAQYTSIDAAYSASVSGDTLLLEGTDITYCLLPDVNKQLTYIGIGFNPNTQIPKRTKIAGAGCGTMWFDVANDSKYYGVEIMGDIMPDAVTTWTNMIFEDCKFSGIISFECLSSVNFVFRNCIFENNNGVNIKFGNSPCGSIFSGIIQNCLFDGYIEGGSASLTTLNIEHCLFLTTTTTCFSNLYNAQIENNIFFNVFPGGTFNCIYENNLCRVPGTFPPNPGNGNTGNNNIENTDPLLVNCPFSTFYASSQGYHLQAGSPAIGAGNDATDIGIHGGFTGFSEQGEVLINPIVRYLNVINSSVQPNGILQVQVNITKPDNN